MVVVPLITPVLGFRLNPGGKLPDVMDQLYGVLPPVACKIWLYAVLTIPEGNGLLVMIAGGVGAGVMVRLNSLSEYRLFEPVTRARKL